MPRVACLVRGPLPDRRGVQDAARSLFLVYEKRAKLCRSRVSEVSSVCQLIEVGIFRIQTASEVLASWHHPVPTSSSGAVPMTLDSSSNRNHHHDVGHVGSGRLHPRPVLGADADPRRDVLRHPRAELRRARWAANLKASLGIDNAQLTVINTATVIGGLVGRLLRRLARGPLRTPDGAGSEPAPLQPGRVDQRGRAELRDAAGQPAASSGSAWAVSSPSASR